MFKESFKYYKSNNPPPDLSNLIQIDENEVQLRVIETKTHQKEISKDLRPFFNDFNQWKVFELVPCPGLILAKNIFTTLGERYLTARCLRDYSLPPNQSNLKTKRLSTAVISDWWNELQKISDAEENVKVRSSLRWVTLGFNHDWDNKVYDEKLKNEFPSDLRQLVIAIMGGLGFIDYEPEAAIVNCYPMNTQLAGHTDHSEYCQKPLISISFGQSAIFLIGGKTKEENASAIHLNHGDVLIMAGESRLCFHAVPKILKSTDEQYKNHCSPFDGVAPNGFEEDLLRKIDKNTFWAPFQDYLSSCRINVNVRQVYEQNVK